MKIFLDTNVIIDFLADRKPYSKYAFQIFEFANQNKVQLYTSPHAIVTTHYLLKKHIDEKSLRKILLNLCDFVSLISIDSQIIQNSLRSNMKDFEDAVQMLTASKESNINFIVTRNIKDFKHSPIPSLTPDEFCEKMS
jgi:predicted nucleic acid-binding protein